MKQEYIYLLITVGILGVIGSFFWRSASLPALIIILFIMIRFGIFGGNK